MNTHRIPAAALAALTLLLAATDALSQAVLINEFMADATRRFAVICDEDGDPEDWIELRNTTGAAVDLSGWSLTDEAAETDKWSFAAGTTIPANGYLLVWASNKDRTTPGSELHTSFELNPSGEFLALYDAAGLPVDFISPSFPDQFPNISYGRVNPAPTAGYDYFLTPTPGAANSTSPGLPAAPVEFSQTSGTYRTNSITVTLSSPEPGATIRYTTNRSLPGPSSTLYTGPITISSSTQLRARAYVAGKAAGTVTSHTYHKVDNGFYNFTSNLPVVVIESFGSGRPNNDTNMHWMIYEPGEVGGRTSVQGTPDFATRARMKVRGSSTAGNAKYSLAVEAWDENNVDKDVTPLGLPPEADWILSARYNFDHALMRNPLIYELSNQVGRYAVRTRFVEVFINTNNGTTSYTGTSSADYMGVYALMEKIDREADRVDVNPLDKADTSLPDISGGYIFKKDRLDPGDSGFNVNIMGRLAHVYPKEDIILSSQRNWLVSYLNQLGNALRTGNNYETYVDVPAWIDHHWLNTLAMNVDGFRLSGYYHKDREGPVVAGPIWDFDRTMGSTDNRDNNPEQWDGTGDSSRTWSDNRYLWWRDFLLIDDVLTAHTDRWFELRQDEFSTANIHAVIDGMAAEIAEGAARNQSRWGRRNFTTEVNVLKDWLARRTAWIDTQYPIPAFSPAPGAVGAGTDVDVASLSGDIYVMTDGTDPRLPGGNPNPAAVLLGGGSTGQVILPLNSTWKYRDTADVFDASDVVVGHPSYNNSSWKHPDFNDNSWPSAQALLGYSNGQTGNSSLERDADNDGDADPTLYFRTTFELDDASGILSATAQVVRDDCAIVYLNGRELGRSNVNNGGRITGDQYVGGTVGGGDETTPFPIAFDPALLVQGTNTVAVEVHQANTGSSDTSFDCSISIVRAGQGNDGITIDSSTPIFARGRMANAGRGPGGVIWGPAVRVNYIVGTPADASNLVVSEINYNPTNPTAAELADGATRDSDFEFVELANISSGPIDLTGVSISGAFDFTFNDPSNAVLQPGQVTLVIRNTAGFEARYGTGLPVAGVWGHPTDPTNDQRLDNDGERIVVTAADRTTPIANFRYNDGLEWPQQADGAGATLTLAEPSQPAPDPALPASWKDSNAVNGTPGSLETGTPYTDWLAASFSAPQLLDPQVSGELADPDLDGLTNLVEFYLGSSPLADTPGHRPTGTLTEVPGSGTFLTVTFRRTTAPGDVTAVVQASGDLENWSSTPVQLGSAVDNGDGTETVTFRDTVPYGSVPHRAVRIAVSSP